jgi:hypothetical protein
VKGNNLLLEEYESPKYNPFKNGSFGPFGTIITHLLADQQVVRNSGTNGWTLADQFTAIFKLDKSDRKTVIILGISAGFASVFGTP